MSSNRPECNPLSDAAYKDGDHGFTLLEILIVILILGIVAMLGWPTFSTAMTTYRLAEAAGEVVNALEYAQTSAVTSGRKTKVVVSKGVSRIAVSQYGTNADLFSGEDELAAVGPSGVETGTFSVMQHPLKKGFAYVVKMKEDDRFATMKIVQSDFEPGKAVTFDLFGAPSKGGTVTIEWEERQIIVRLNALSGKVTVSD